LIARNNINSMNSPNSLFFCNREAVEEAKSKATSGATHDEIVEDAMDRVIVKFGLEILKIVPGKVPLNKKTQNQNAITTPRVHTKHIFHEFFVLNN
jgi:hypothetical protein